MTEVRHIWSGNRQIRKLQVEVRIDGMLILWDTEDLICDPQHMLGKARHLLGRLVQQMWALTDRNRQFFVGKDAAPAASTPWSLIQAACGEDEALKTVLRGTPAQVAAYFKPSPEPTRMYQLRNPVTGVTPDICYTSLAAVVEAQMQARAAGDVCAIVEVTP